MHSKLDDLQLSIDTEGIKVNSAIVGDMVTAYLRRNAAIEIPNLVKGLPNDVCRAPHWGYVVEGSVILDYEDGTHELVRAGEVFYFPPGPPGHAYKYDEDVRIIEFSPLAQMIPVAEAISRNLGAESHVGSSA